LKESRPILSAAKCSPGTLVSDGIRFMQIFVGIPWQGGLETTVGWSDPAIFHEVFYRLFSDLTFNGLEMPFWPTLKSICRRLD